VRGNDNVSLAHSSYFNKQKSTAFGGPFGNPFKMGTFYDGTYSFLIGLSPSLRFFGPKCFSGPDAVSFCCAYVVLLVKLSEPGVSKLVEAPRERSFEALVNEAPSRSDDAD
jgi:hypothetical protein